MKGRSPLVTVLLVLFAALSLKAQESRTNIEGGIQAASATFNSISPSSSSFKLNSGTIFALHGLKSMGLPGFYLVGAAQYLKTSGALNYNYTSPNSVTYQATGVNFAYDNFSVLLGVRVKLLDRSLVRPFVEGAVSGGYTQILFDSNLRTAAVVAAGSDYKTTDTSLDFGINFSAGLEVQMTKDFSLELFYRYLRDSMRALATFNNASPIFEGQFWGAGINIRF